MPHNSRQDKPSQRDNSCSVSGTDLRDPRESRSAASAQQLLCWHKPKKKKKTFQDRVQASTLNAETVTLL